MAKTTVPPLSPGDVHVLLRLGAEGPERLCFQLLAELAASRQETKDARQQFNALQDEVRSFVQGTTGLVVENSLLACATQGTVAPEASRALASLRKEIESLSGKISWDEND